MKTSEPREISFSALGARAGPPTIARLMSMTLENPQLLSLAAGFTDNATLPAWEVRAAADALIQEATDQEYLQYGMNQGRPRLRALLAERLRTLEPTLTSESLLSSVFITNGSQQALYLAMQVLCDPGDLVLVDRPSYFVFLEMLTGLGLRARSLPIDASGRIDGAQFDRLLDELKKSGDAQRLKAVYFVSYFSNPSARSLDDDEKEAIANILAKHDLIVPVIEDAAYRDLYFKKPHEARSVLSLAAWAEFPKLYLSTLTKPFATGLKVGYGFCTAENWRKRMLHVKGHHDFGTANFNQAVLERVLAGGAFDGQLARIRPAYEAKMNALHEVLVSEGLPELGWRWRKPSGGLYLWLEGPSNLNTGLPSPFCRACVDSGVLYVPGELCFGDEVPTHFVRLSFGVLGETDLAEAGRRFVAVARRFA